MRPPRDQSTDHTPRPPTRRRRSLTAGLALLVSAGLLTAAGPSAEASFSVLTNTDGIIIRDPVAGQAGQEVTPYPASVTQWGIDGPITDVNVDLNNVTFGHANDIDIMLVSPEGTAVVLMSGPCGAAPIIRSYLTFDDEAAQSMPFGGTCTTGSYKPTSAYHATFPPPAPPKGSTAPYYPRTLSEFRGENPNGTWRLFVHDSFTRQGDGTDHGVILGGFRVFITTESRSVVIPGNMNGAGPATQYPAVESVAGMNGSIEDVFVYLHNLSHNRPDDLDIVLVAPGGQKVLLMSDACGGIPIPNGTTFRFNHDDPSIPDQGICNTGPGGSGVNFSPTDHAPADSLPAPAPSGPYTSLAALRGTSPNGTWRLYVHDDLTDRSGYLQDFSLSFDLGPQAPDTIAPHTAISSGPGATTRSRRARFVFAANESPATFQCRLDSKAWASCTSPRTYRRLSVGQHQVRVRATDAAGNRDASPAKWTWRVRR